MHHHRHHHAPEPLAKLTIADSIFLGYVCTHRSLAAIEQFRDYLINQVHPDAAHVPFAASVENAAVTLDGDDITETEINNDSNNNSTSEGITQEGYDDDDEPTGSSIGKSLLFELNRYKHQLRRQATIKIRGSHKKENYLWDGDDSNDDDDVDGHGGGSNCDSSVQGDDSDNNNGPPIVTAVIIVRYFQKRLLGVTCGRLKSVYGRAARLTLHRHLYGTSKAYVERYTFGRNNERNLYGLGAGDTELILDVVPVLVGNKEKEEEGAKQITGEGVNYEQEEIKEQQNVIVRKLVSELHFEGMVGSQNEPLPRLQNLQADLPIIDIFHDSQSNSSNNNNENNNNKKNNHHHSTKDHGANMIIPIYRYPGNYSGTEWPTHQWSPTTLSIKRSVEKALQPLYVQHMNHCVSNLYRDGYDRIDHHSDKDLDLNRSGVIVSVSLGSRRVMEVRDRQFPHDVARVDLPPGSMFVLGPETNARFTHAVLPMDDFGDREGRENGDCDDGDEEGDEMTENTKCSIEDGGRISLTFRDVRTFLDAKTQRLFGQGVVSSFDTPILVQDGVITEESLSRAVQHVREEERRDGTKAIIVASVIGVGAGYVSCLNNGKADKVGGSDSLTEKLAGVTGLSLLRSVSVAAISASASYCYHRYLRNEMRRRREEKDAREFFSKKSASGNKY